MVLRFLTLVAALLTTFRAVAAPVSYADTVEGLLPSVVSVSSIKTADAVPDMAQALNGSPFEDFFNRFRRDGDYDAEKTILLGSGFVYDDEGSILTSAHVVESLNEVTVTLNDGKTVTATVAGRDPKTDLALLKTKAKHLKPVKIGNSDAVRIGDPVLAIGNAFGLGNTVTSGIVSARSRDIQVGPYDDFIQTDAAINKGNSGGPLFNTAGEMIGVNTAIFSPSGGSVGIAFAVPSKIVRFVADSLKKHGKVRRGRLGVKIQTVSPETAKSVGLSSPKGALITDVEDPKSPLKQGDIVLTFNGRKVPSMKALPRMAAAEKVGSKVKLGVWRNGKTVQLTQTLTELPDPDKKKPLVIATADTFPIPLIGLTAAELTPALKLKAGIPAEKQGLLITAVAKNSDADKKGLQTGDILLELDKVPVPTADAVARWATETAEMGLDAAFMLIERNGERFFSVVKFVMPED